MSLALIARCAATGRLGIAVASEWPFLAFAAIGIRPGVGAAVTTGAVSHATRALPLNLLAQGFSPNQALAQALQGDADRDHRQLAVLSAEGVGAAISGRVLEDRAAAFAHVERDLVGIGHSLPANRVVTAAVQWLNGNAQQPLEHRLIGALEAARDAGSSQVADRHFIYRSAGILVYGSASYAEIDMRVDAQEHAVDQLRTILDEQHLFDQYFEERRRNPDSTEMADEFVARMKRNRIPSRT